MSWHGWVCRCWPNIGAATRRSILPSHIWQSILKLQTGWLPQQEKKHGLLRNNPRQQNLCPLKSVEEMEKSKRGNFDYVTDVKSCLTVLHWNDNNIVNTVSNKVGVAPPQIAKLWSRSETKRVEITQPFMVKHYNQTMGGVDQMDQNVDKSCFSIRSKRWWWPLFAWHSMSQKARTSVPVFSQLFVDWTGMCYTDETCWCDEESRILILSRSFDIPGNKPYSYDFVIKKINIFLYSYIYQPISFKLGVVATKFYIFRWPSLAFKVTVMWDIKTLVSILD